MPAFPLTLPDDLPTKVALPGLLVCSPTTRCSFVLDIPGAGPIQAGSLRIVALDPPAGTELVRGQQVSISATLEYAFPGTSAMIAMVAGNPSAQPPPAPVASEFLMVPAGQVTLKGSVTVPFKISQFGVLIVLVTPDGGGGATTTQANYRLKDPDR